MLEKLNCYVIYRLQQSMSQGYAFGIKENQKFQSKSFQATHIGTYHV